jgi:plastocyanin
MCSLMQKAFSRVTIPAALVTGLSALLLLGLVSTYSTRTGASGQYSTNTGASGQEISKNAFQLSAKLDTSVNPPFKWVNTTNGVINPTLNFKANTNEVIQIQNPTDFKHQFIIDQNGKQLATSGDIASGGSGQVSFKPNMIGTFGYHCLYHPTTMKGIIQVQ